MTTPDTPALPDRKHLADGELRCEADAWVAGPAVERVLEALAELSAQHDWWAQPLAMSSSSDDGRLRGAANLTLVGYETPGGELVEVEPEDDAFMAWMDLCVAVDFLRALSAVHALAWRLAYGGEPIGGIVDGHESDELEAFIVALGEAVGADFDERDDARAEALDDAYSGRE